MLGSSEIGGQLSDDGDVGDDVAIPAILPVPIARSPDHPIHGY